MGEAKEVLGLDINLNRSNCSLFLHQVYYADEILERVGMKNPRPVTTPHEGSSKSEPELFTDSF